MKIYFCALLLLIIGCTPVIQTTTNQSFELDTSPSPFLSDSALQIGLWNVQVLGDAKVAKPAVYQYIIEQMKKYDIIVIQEIRDADGSAWAKICNDLPEHNCLISSRAGRSSSKEQIGIAYSQKIMRLDTQDFNPDLQDRWERPPYKAVFSIAPTYNLTLYTMHISPSDVSKEFTELEGLVHSQNETGKVIVLGDFNLDCDYFDETNITQFENWTYSISNEFDTNLAPSSCTYDRMILNPLAAETLIARGVYGRGMNANMSDHYIVWNAFEVSEWST